MDSWKDPKPAWELVSQGVLEHLTQVGPTRLSYSGKKRWGEEGLGDHLPMRQA
jgi:hypothetical protein